MPLCLLSLGSNLGERQQILSRACACVAGLPHSQLLLRSTWHRTRPIGGPSGQGEFLNGAAVIQTRLPPAELVRRLQAVEAHLGRERRLRWEARLLDIDLLLYANQHIETPTLQVPHPRMTYRRFVLEPAVEVAGAWTHPQCGWTLSQLLRHLQQAPRAVVIAADMFFLAEWLIDQLVSHGVGCPRLEPPKDEPSTLPALLPASPQLASANPALWIVWQPSDPEQLLAQIGGSQSSRPKKKWKKKVHNFFEKKPRRTHSETTLEVSGGRESWQYETVWGPAPAGPQLKICSHDPQAVVQEAVAAIGSIWPDLQSKKM